MCNETKARDSSFCEDTEDSDFNDNDHSPSKKICLSREQQLEDLLEGLKHKFKNLPENDPLRGPEGTDAPVGEALETRKRNRCGAEKRRARREREKALAGQTPCPSTTPESAPKEGEKGHAGKRSRPGSVDTPPSAQRVNKKPRAQDAGPYVAAADPLARAIVLEGYPEKALTPEQLTLIRGAVVNELAGIREDPLPRFTGTAVLRNGAVIIRGEDELALNWLSERIGHISPWEGAKPKVAGLDALQKRHRAAVWLPGPPVPAAAVLGLLERQNPGFATASWQVFAENVGASSDGRTLILGIPESSVLKLRARDFRMSYGLEQVSINLLGARSGGKSASAVLARRVAVTHTHISLLQEPWVFRDCIRGITACGRLYKSPAEAKPRAAIAVKGVNAQLMPEFCSRDVVAVAVELVRANAGDLMRVVVCSAYFPHEEENLLPPGPLDRLIRHCQKDGLPLIVGCDSNVHHVFWGSTDIKDRGRRLLDLVATDLEILNRGGEPTFQTAVRSKVLDLTFCSRSLVDSVVDWRVSQEPSLSDRKQIVFGLANMKPEVIRRRNPRKTNWTTFGQQLANNLEGFPRRHGTNEKVELCAEHLKRVLISSYEASCPEKTVGSNRKISWWGPELQNLRAEARRAWNRARNMGRQSDWDLYRRSQKAYGDSISVAKRRNWRGFCESMESFPEVSRLYRILARNPDSTPEAVRLPEGEMVLGERCLVHLLETSFPSFSKETGDELHRWPTEPNLRARGEDWSLAAIVVKPEKIKWAIGTFKPFKSPGPDGIFPALLQEGLGLIIGPLTRTLRACLALSYIPKAWRLARVVFIPKMGRTCCSSAKDFRPISLTSFLLKTLEKLIDVYLRDVVLGRHPLHVNQHAYRAGYSTETALHALVSQIEGQLETGGYPVGTFLDIEGAFNNTPHEVICREASRRGIPDGLVSWIRRMLRRRIVASLGSSRVGGLVERGCPQGGVLSPLLWCLVVDRLLEDLNDRGIYAQGYADDLAILVRGPFLDTLIKITQSALETVEG
ncbi:lian-aa1 retrotransposon protein [Lasius niger]|uniref:Lian-aa1 retrotransposon protein n=1 Tax=Lasius niger TaxID=67767 RepID=A0A0J7N8F6_LASNI|nr:lian-aa1 retrotransposon protein [Lasius niger]